MDYTAELDQLDAGWRDLFASAGIAWTAEVAEMALVVIHGLWARAEAPEGCLLSALDESVVSFGYKIGFVPQ